MYSAEYCRATSTVDAFALAFDVEDVGVDRLAGAVEVLRRTGGGRRRTGTIRFSPVRSSAIVIARPG